MQVFKIDLLTVTIADDVQGPDIQIDCKREVVKYISGLDIGPACDFKTYLDDLEDSRSYHNEYE